MAKSKAKSGDSGAAVPNMLPVPGVELWTGPMAWAGPGLKPVQDWAGQYPVDTVFVRGQFQLTLQTSTGPGMWKTEFPNVPALIRLEKGKAVEAHAPGPDGRCWTYRLEKEGRKSRWKLYAGNTYPATESAEIQWTAPWKIEYAIIQSILPEHGSGKYVSLMIQEDGSVENLARAKDPDPND